METGNARIELIAPTREDSEISGFLAKRGEGIHHICVAVSDIEQAVAEMKGRGARIVGDGIVEHSVCTRCCRLRSPLHSCSH